MTLSRAGGISALICALTYVIGMAVLLVILVPLGYLDTPVGELPLAVQTVPGVMIAWNTVIYIVNALALIVLVTALSAQMRTGAPAMAAVAQGAGLIWAALVLGAGMIANVAVELATAHPDTAAPLWHALHAVELGLGGGNEIAGGFWITVVSLGAGHFGRGIRLVGAFTGLSGVATIVPAVGDPAGAVFGVGAILWFFLIAARLWRDAPISASIK
ncbi:MAG: hypothetical protein CMM86_08455 [Rhodovulum sp.]|nr:hypothetical protein [Rhodovulum sp.]